MATIFSATPAAFSSSVRFLEEFPISTLPAVTASTPAPEPVNSAVTVTPGYLAIKLSARAFANFSIEVEPAMEILPLKSAAASEEGASLLTASEDAASGAASLPGASDAAVAALTFEVSAEPQPASTAITRVAAVAIATNFFS